MTVAHRILGWYRVTVPSDNNRSWRQMSLSWRHYWWITIAFGFLAGVVPMLAWNWAEQASNPTELGSLIGPIIILGNALVFGVGFALCLCTVE